MARGTLLVDAGRHIYAYYHIRTNQVLYSFARQLNGQNALAQLPDAGANNNPPKLRKDLWRPLWTLSIPDSATAKKQGLHIFTKLRQWRIAHELTWSPPNLLHRLHTAEEIEEMKEKLTSRGGSKKESVYDVIKHNKRKMRAYAVMNQKANSIADLAAILAEQEQIEALAMSLVEVAKPATSPTEEANGAVATSPVVNPNDTQPDVTQARSFESQGKTSMSKYAHEHADVRDTQKAREEARVRDREAERLERLMRRRKADALARQLKLTKQPMVFPVIGISIAWNNLLDAEYAKAWPASIMHEPMGLIRHKAPEPGMPAYLNVARFRRASMKRRNLVRTSVREPKESSIRTDIVAKVTGALVSRYALSKEVLAMLPQAEDRRSRIMRRLKKVLRQSDV